jgi:hypothetical protein
LVLPAWFASTLQVPAAVKLTVEPDVDPESEQPEDVASRVSVTGRPEDAVAVTV